MADTFTNASGDRYIIPSDHWYPTIIDPIPTNDSTFKDDTEWFQHLISNIPSWEHQLLTGTTFCMTVDIITDSFQKPNSLVTFVNDGGHVDNYGSFGWVIVTDDHLLIDCQGTALGTPMSSNRAEAIGKLSWIVFLNQFKRIHNICTQCTFDSYLDNLEIVQATQLTAAYHYASSALKPDYDIMIAISMEQASLLNTSKLTNTQHVKSHQANNQHFDQLSRQARLNIRADELASLALQKIPRTYPSPPTIPNPHCLIYLKDGVNLATSKEKQLLQWKWSEIRLQKYYKRIFELSTHH